MIEELNAAITEYQATWNNLVDERANAGFFRSLRPTAVAWKAEDLADFDIRVAELRDLSDQVHLGWVNERWLATFHLKDQSLPMGMTIIKLMQRRSGSNDAVGLDHIDFYYKPSPQTAKELFAEEPSLKWDEETNGDHCKWISIWFADTEAKIRSDTVLDICASEMKDIEKEILS